MSRRRLLNITSQKKHDSMMITTNANATNMADVVYSNSPAILTGEYAVPYTFVWCATARDNDRTPGNFGSKYDVGTRSVSTPYMVGLSEKVEIQVANGIPWQWRRICVTLKGGDSFAGLLPDGTSFHTNLLDTSGYRRVVNSILDTRRTNFENFLFSGVKNTDWIDPMIAQVDSNHMTVMYDKTRTISSGNEDGLIRSYKLWHPMRHNLNYNDDEAGGGTGTSRVSILGKKGMGDYWVIDYFQPRTGAVKGDQLLFRPQAKLYWHEK